MSDSASGEPKTFTQEELEAAVEERNKALEAKRDELLAELRGTKAKLREADSTMADLQSRIDAIEQANEAKEKGISSDQIQELQEKAIATVEKKWGPIKQQLEEANARIRELSLDNVVKSTMAKSGVRGERVDALFRLTKDRFDLTDDGQPMLKDDPSVPIRDYITETVAEEFPEFYEGTGSSGGGAPKSAASGSGRQIAQGDNDAFLANLEKIAGGEIKVAVE